ncbi:hypothetical protein PIB30_031560 [Stylosanthes scabra]|uniref:DUF4283 domain-containing protein n=1 Tax=Stylosanthes scabra TaxID=79078 RepID=A0ABU6RCJ3_9FABA|nr:hypothetical protein [Stylosanthes scabra]
MEGSLATTAEDLKQNATNDEEEELFIYEEEKTINPSWVHNAMHYIWRKPEGFQMKEIEEKLYQFFFEKEGDMKRALKGSPWSFKNSWLLMKKWERNVNPSNMDFSKTEVNVQIWNLLEHCKTTKPERNLILILSCVNVIYK